MSKKQYTVTTVERTAQPRSKRRQGSSSSGGGGSVVVSGQSEVDAAENAELAAQAHSHANKPLLDSLSDADGYLLLRQKAEDADDSEQDKVKAGYADEAKTLTRDSDVWQKVLRKDVDDSAAGKITFASGTVHKAMSRFEGGLQSGSYIKGRGGSMIDADGDAEFGSIALRDSITAGEYIEGSSGARISVDEDGVSTAEVDFLTVRRAAKFREITIQELKHIGGEIALTAAAMECSRVERVNGGYMCYFETTDGERTIYQEFVVGDQARCQQFKLEDGGEGYLSTRYYWRMVKEVGEDYILLSDIQGEYDGTGIPAAGDKIVQLGYRKEYNNNNEIPYRTTAIILSATSNDAPSTKYYEGITRFSLDNVVKDEGYSNGNFHSKVYGSSYTGAKDRSSYVEYTVTDGLKVNGELSVGSRLADGTDVNNLVTANINLLLNSGFTGDYMSQPVESTDNVNADTEIYSPSFLHWDYNNGCLIRASQDSVSGYEVLLSSAGVLSQTIDNIEQTDYVISFKASGVDVTVSFGGKVKTYELSETPKYCAFKVANPQNGVFRLSTNGGCSICEPMVAVGNVFDTWSKSPKDNDKAMDEIYAYSYLMNALNQASTTINKGLILSQLIKVGNYRNGQMVEETGGMNGLVVDSNNGNTDPFIWGGGTMEQALYTIMKYKDDPSYQATDEEVAQMAKFVVTHGGRAILNDIILRGYIYAEGGVFNGTLIANKGTIGGLEISDEGLGIQGTDVAGSVNVTFLSSGTFEYTRTANGVVQAQAIVGQDYIIGGYRDPVLNIVVTSTDSYMPSAAGLSCQEIHEGIRYQGDALRIQWGYVRGLKIIQAVYSRSPEISGDYIQARETSIVIVEKDDSLVWLDNSGNDGAIVLIKSIGLTSIGYRVRYINMRGNEVTETFQNNDLHIYYLCRTGEIDELNKREKTGWVKLQ